MDIQVIEARNKDEWRIHNIAEASQAAGQYHFRPMFMKLCGDVRRNFGVLYKGDKIFIKRYKPASKLPSLIKAGLLYPFDPETGLIGPPQTPELFVKMEQIEL